MHTIVRISLLAFVVASSCLSAFRAIALEIEARCTDLGSTCLCSEPMNWQENGGEVYGGGIDPSDSEGGSAKECGANGETALWDSTPGWRSIAVPDKPAGASEDWVLVQEVTHVSDDGNNINWWVGDPVSTTGGTLCVRHYSHIGTLSPVANANHRIKVSQWFGNTANLTQLEWAWDQYEDAQQYLRAQSPGTHGTVVSFEDCRGAWCRIEYCVDYDGDDTKPNWRVRITKVGSPSETEVIGPVEQANDQPAPLAFTNGDQDQVAIGDVFAQCLETEDCPTGTRHIAFGIQTLVEPMNTAFWPGGASEVEDGDMDEVVSTSDNCISAVNTSQIDTDSDGCGNACDADYNQSGGVDGADFTIFKATYLKGSGDPGYDARADFDEDDAITSLDFGFFNSSYLGTPGPSGLPESAKSAPACP